MIRNSNVKNISSKIDKIKCANIKASRSSDLFIKSITPVTMVQSLAVPDLLDCNNSVLPDHLCLLSRYDDYIISGFKSQDVTTSGGVADLYLSNIKQYRLSRFGALWSDLCAGLYNYITNNAIMDDVDFLYNKAGVPIVLVLRIKYIDLLRCVFGCCVASDGSIAYGLRSVLQKRSIKDLNSILKKEICEPVLLACDVTNRVIGYDTPIHIKAKNENDEYLLELDLRYFPIKLSKDNLLVASNRYIAGVAGLYSMCLIGVDRLRSKGEDVPNALKVYEFMKIVQACYCNQSYLHIKKLILKDNIYITFDDLALQSLFCCYRCVRGSRYIDYKKCLAIVTGSAMAFIEGLRAVCYASKVGFEKFNFCAVPVVCDGGVSVAFVNKVLRLQVVGGCCAI